LKSGDGIEVGKACASFPEGDLPRCGRIVRQAVEIEEGQREEISLRELTSRRDFVDVRDVAAAAWSLATLPSFQDRCAGRAFNLGSGKDPSEWDDHNTPDDLSDDISRINKNANRLGIIKTVRSADEQLGRLLNHLKERGAYDDAYIIVESDHNMETNSFVGPPLHKILPESGYSKKTDYCL
jgi:nucleoside-diphosphate-sugar epimerase